MSMTDTFSTRLIGAIEKEKADAAILEQKYGCVVTRFGQGQLPNEFRRFLLNHPKRLYIRWLADLLVARPDLCLARAAESIWLVDSKYGRLDTAFWVLEKAAHEAHRLQQNALSLPNVYLWPDGNSCSYVDDLPDEALKDGPPMRSGSGTPYWLVPKELARPFQDVFGKECKGMTA
jgi:hypothetical protein